MTSALERKRAQRRRQKELHPVTSRIITPNVTGVDEPTHILMESLGAIADDKPDDTLTGPVNELATSPAATDQPSIPVSKAPVRRCKWCNGVISPERKPSTQYCKQACQLASRHLREKLEAIALATEYLKANGGALSNQEIAESLGIYKINVSRARKALQGDKD